MLDWHNTFSCIFNKMDIISDRLVLGFIPATFCTQYGTAGWSASSVYSSVIQVCWATPVCSPHHSSVTSPQWNQHVSSTLHHGMQEALGKNWRSQIWSRDKNTKTHRLECSSSPCTQVHPGMSGVFVGSSNFVMSMWLCELTMNSLITCSLSSQI